MVARPLMQIAAADANRGHLDEHVIGTNLRHLDFPQLHAVFIRREIYDGGLGHGKF